MDLATIFGLIGGFSLIAIAMVLGGSPAAFIDIPSVLIVIGGTFAVTAVSFSVQEIIAAQKIAVHALRADRRDPVQAAQTILQLAERARKDGILGLQNMLAQYRDIPFLYKALSLVIDGTTGDDVENIMRRDLAAMNLRHAKSADVLRRAAEVAPAMGLIGTLVGLVQMLGNLDDPSTIGPSMAVALLTTFYGAILANMVFTPLATKLERNSRKEYLLNTVYTMGAASIGRRENPRRLEVLINTQLPPSNRIQYFD